MAPTGHNVTDFPSIAHFVSRKIKPRPEALSHKGGFVYPLKHFVTPLNLRVALCNESPIFEYHTRTARLRTQHQVPDSLHAIKLQSIFHPANALCNLLPKPPVIELEDRV